MEWAERMGILRTRKVELFLSESLSIFQLSRCHWCDMLSSNKVSSYQVLEQPQELSAFMLIGAIVAFVLFLSLGAVLFALWEVGKTEHFIHIQYLQSHQSVDCIKKVCGKITPLSSIVISHFCVQVLLVFRENLSHSISFLGVDFL